MRRLIERLARVVGLDARAARLTMVAAAVAMAACGRTPPRITITEIPPAALGGSIRTATIAGHVEGARPGDRIVLFAKSGVWYVQPLVGNPFTAIDARGRWRSTIHLGTAYAAMVVREGYRPPDSAPALPEVGSRVLATTTVDGTSDSVGGSYVDGPTPAPPLQFSGYEWDVRQRRSDRGGANEYSAANARVDADGALRLTLARHGDLWTSAGVCLLRPLGYGTYVFIVRDLTEIDPAARLALFTFDEKARAEHFREMNIDLWSGGTSGTSHASGGGDRGVDAGGGRVGGAGAGARARAGAGAGAVAGAGAGGQFVLQPNYLPGNVFRFSLPPGLVSYTMRWEPGVVAFKSMRGNFLERPGGEMASQTFTTGVPGPGDERVCMAFYYHRKSAREPRTDTAIVIERFQYLP